MEKDEESGKHILAPPIVGGLGGRDPEPSPAPSGPRKRQLQMVDDSSSDSEAYNSDAGKKKEQEVAAKAPPKEGEVGNFEVRNKKLLRQVNTDVTVKLFCFAFISELVEDHLYVQFLQVVLEKGLYMYHKLHNSQVKLLRY